MSLAAARLAQGATKRIVRRITQDATRMKSPAVTPSAAPPAKGPPKTFFNDPATYPLVAIMGFALVGASIFGFRAMLFSPDVRITKNKRNQVIRDWAM
ncbi:hypothetical protein M885DRAFT_512227 [Pelagophyceae sp. CCMP2097]|nr:hypothetical protein M885DRAFT_512227 [Pelagophyceae sp. CCMP2097]